MIVLPGKTLRSAVLLLGAMLTMSPDSAAAQAPDGTTAGQPSAIAELISAPAPGEHAVSLTLGVQIKDGRTETRGLSIDGWAAHTSLKHQMWRFDAELTRAEFRPAPTAPRLVVEDNHQFSLTFTHPLRDRIDLLARGLWRRDQPLELDHRLLGLGGVAFHPVRTKTAHLVVAPVIGAGRQSSTLPEAREGIVDIGLLQTLTWRITPTFAIQNSFDIFRDVDNGDDRSAALDISGTAMIAKHVGVKLSYEYTHDTIRPPSTSASQQEFSAGVTITFRGKAP